MTPAASLEFKHNSSHKSHLGFPVQLQQELMAGSSKKIRQNSSDKAQISNRCEGLRDLSFPHVLRFGVRLWLPYLEGHNEMSEMKLSLQVQLDSHIFQTCRGREKKSCSKQGHLPASTSKFCQSSSRRWHRDSFLCQLSLLSKRDMRVSALLRYGGDTKDLLKSVPHMGFLCVTCTKHITPKA